MDALQASYWQTDSLLEQHQPGCSERDRGPFVVAYGLVEGNCPRIGFISVESDKWYFVSVCETLNSRHQCASNPLPPMVWMYDDVEHTEGPCLRLSPEISLEKTWQESRYDHRTNRLAILTSNVNRLGAQVFRVGVSNPFPNGLILNGPAPLARPNLDGQLFG